MAIVCKTWIPKELVANRVCIALIIKAQVFGLLINEFYKLTSISNIDDYTI